MEKIIHNNFTSQKDILIGVKMVADAVGATFGAAGSNVMIESGYMPPKITKDGVSVARTIRVSDPVQNMGAQALIELSKKILERIGDGTTTACVFGEALVDELLKVKEFVNRENLNKICDHIEELIESSDKFQEINDSNYLKTLTGVARISSNKDKEITQNIHEALKHVGITGAIVIEDSKDSKTKIIPKYGMQIDFGYSNVLFTNKADRLCFDHENVNLIIYDGTLESFDASCYFWEQYIKEKLTEPLLLVSRGFGGLAEMGIVQNITSQDIRLKFCNITVTGTDEEILNTLRDVSAATGAPILGREYDKEFALHKGRIELEDLTKISKASVFRNYSLFVSRQDRTEYLNDYKRGLESELSSLDDETDRSKIENRLARLSQKIISIGVGAQTETAQNEIKDRYEDTVYAIRSAIKFGVIPAGGFLWMQILENLNTLPHSYECDVFKKAIAKTLVKLYRGVLNDKTNQDFEPKEDNLSTSLDIIRRHREKGLDFIYDLKSKEFVEIEKNDFYEPVAIIKNVIPLANTFAWDLSSSEVTIHLDRDAFKKMIGN